MKLWQVAPFFHSLLVWFWFYKTLQHISCTAIKKWHAAMFYKTKTKPKVSEKKGATCQSFIRKEITCYRIGTLVCCVSTCCEVLPVHTPERMSTHFGTLWNESGGTNLFYVQMRILMFAECAENWKVQCGKSLSEVVFSIYFCELQNEWMSLVQVF